MGYILKTAAGQGAERPPARQGMEQPQPALCLPLIPVEEELVREELSNQFRRVNEFWSGIPKSLWLNPKAPPSALRLWCFLDDLSNDANPTPWPSYNTIAKGSKKKKVQGLGIDRSSAIRAANWLRENGYLEVSQRDGFPNHYVLTCPKLVAHMRLVVASVPLGGGVDATTTSGVDATLTNTNDNQDQVTKTGTTASGPDPGNGSGVIPSVDAETEPTRSEIAEVQQYLAGLYQNEFEIKPELTGTWGRLKVLCRDFEIDLIKRVLSHVYNSHDFTDRQNRDKPLWVLKADTFNHHRVLLHGGSRLE